jgi:RNA polymerase sigma-70 factor (ECF subfamily)
VTPSGDRQFRREIRALLPRLSRFAFGLTRSRADADDLVQAACERALSRTVQWDPTTRLDSWMFRIIQTIWFNEVRGRKVRERHTRAEQAASNNEVSGQKAELRVLLRRVEEEIFRLPVEQRTVLMLVCVEGLTYTETAQVVSVPVGTVMSRLARARLTLMQRLEGVDAINRDRVTSLVSK